MAIFVSCAGVVSRRALGGSEARLLMPPGALSFFMLFLRESRFETHV